MSRIARYCSVIGVLVALPVPAFGQGGETESLRSAGLKKWSELRQAIDSLDVTYTRYESYIAGQPPVPIKSHVLANGKSFLASSRSPLQFREPDKAKIDRVVGRTPEYVYSLERKEGEKEYRLGYLGQETPELSKRILTADKARLMPLFVYQKNILEWLKEPEFVVRSISRVEQDGRSQIKLEARYTPAGEARAHLPEFVAWFDERAAWAVQKYEVKAWYGRVTATVEYSSTDGVPVPRRITEVITYDDKKTPQATSSIEIESWKVRPIADGEFLIGQFGLPEPQSVTPASRKESWRWVWLLCGAVLTGSVGIWMFRRSRQSGATEKPS